MLRPYTEGVSHLVDREDPVQVVGHHDERVERYVRKVPRDLEPTLGGRAAGSVQAYLPLDDVAKQAVAHLNADCDEVDART